MAFLCYVNSVHIIAQTTSSFKLLKIHSIKRHRRLPVIAAGGLPQKNLGFLLNAFQLFGKIAK